MATNDGHGGGRQVLLAVRTVLRFVSASAGEETFDRVPSDSERLCNVLDLFTVVGQHQQIHQIAI